MAVSVVCLSNYPENISSNLIKDYCEDNIMVYINL
jgi:hypothetical protein